MSMKSHPKLAMRYYPQLHENALIYSVFHVSQLKRVIKQQLVESKLP